MGIHATLTSAAPRVDAPDYDELLHVALRSEMRWVHAVLSGAIDAADKYRRDFEAARDRLVALYRMDADLPQDALAFVWAVHA